MISQSKGPSADHQQILSRRSSDKSILSEQLEVLTDSPKAHLLHELVHELERIINTDILPRWKKKTVVVESYLDGEPALSKTAQTALP